MTVDRAFADYREIDKVAQRPPMGWNSWDVYGVDVTEDEVKATARVMAERLKPSGYDTVVIDMAWYAPGASAIGRSYLKPDIHQLIDQWGRFIPDPARFPSSAGGRGFKPLADYVHSLGLKFGIHVLRGIPIQAVHANTPIRGSDRRAREVMRYMDRCVFYDGLYALDMSRPGAMEYCQSVLDLYAEWGVDYIKVDDMISYPQHFDEGLAFRWALDHCGRKMTLSLSPGSIPFFDRSYVNHISDLFRVTGDVWDKWSDLRNAFDAARTWKGHTGPGRWADLDMIPLGLINVRAEAGHGERRDLFTPAERRTLMSLWCIFRSPLMLGCDLTRLDPETLALVTNAEALRCDQHSVGNDEVASGGDFSIWRAEDPESGDVYAALFNLGEQGRTLEIELARLGAAAGCTAIDIWSGAREAVVGTHLRVEVEPHGVKFARLSRR
jgi:hypothetical protein